ncbi:MAG: DUF2061 domain-containing protein [Bacteroidales bacterium]|nr:DUF2061 domain-containing protein [Bacteroidales bacterium]
MKSENQNTKAPAAFRDSPGRSLLKTITYRIFASGAMFVGVFIFARQYQKLTMAESLTNASFIAFLEFVVKLIIYYIHERIWSGISWGKYWQRKFWARKAWKKMYRKAHD